MQAREKARQVPPVDPHQGIDTLLVPGFDLGADPVRDDLIGSVSPERLEAAARRAIAGRP